tara:strand:+ start:514 stop:1302 length:789 start_codon:yes stop_codon:yes gene_type:complete
VTEYQCLKIEKEGPIAIVRFNRPGQLNALSSVMMLEIEQLSRDFLEDESTRVVIFGGEGKHFCVGMDLRDDRVLSKNLVKRRREVGLGGRMIKAITEINQITIASIHGAALGGGACIATACDFRVASEDAVCGYPEINLGMNLQWLSLPLCVRLIGPARAKRMVMLGDKENASTLLDWGFFDEVVPFSNLREVSFEFARRYARQAPAAAQMIKQSINALTSSQDNALMHMDADQFLLTSNSEDRKEGMNAFFEKRDPDFSGG